MKKQHDNGCKNDDGKPPITYLTREFLEGTAMVMGFGAKKYGEWNFCQGIAYTRLVNACMRHLIAFIDNENVDAESGLSHIYHACANLNMLCGMMKLHPEQDDRFKP